MKFVFSPDAILFYSVDLNRPNAGKTLESFFLNAVEWTERVEISKEEIPGSNRSM